MTEMPEPSETALQLAISDYLNGFIRTGDNSITHTQVPFPDLVWSYTGGEGREESDIYWNKRKGRRKGLWDYVSWAIAKFHALEAKVKNRPLTFEQKTFKTAFEAQGGITKIVQSVVEVRDFYIAQGLECKNRVCIEPKLSAKQKLELSNIGVMEALQKRKEEWANKNA